MIRSDDWNFTAQYLYTRPRDGFLWTNFAQTQLAQTQPLGVAPDGRPIYADLDDLGINNLTVLGNFEGGSSHTWSVALAKRWSSGVDFSVSYAKQNIQDTTEGTSSRGTFGTVSGTRICRPRSAMRLLNRS